MKNGTTVVWERWFRQGLSLHFGDYREQSKQFTSREAANGFAEGLKLDEYNRQVEVK